MEPHVSKHLFVYSSLRKGFHQASYNYVTQYFSLVSNAKIEGIVSDVDGKHFATPGVGNSFIIGELYKLNDELDFSYVFGQLDDYEGLIVEQGEQPLYRRELTQVYHDDGIVTDAWIYWFNGDVRGKSIATSGNIVDIPVK